MAKKKQVAKRVTRAKRTGTKKKAVSTETNGKTVSRAKKTSRATAVASKPKSGRTLTKAQEEARLKKCEAEIQKNLEGFVAAGKALKEIQTDKLYKRAGYDTFNEYCRARWDFTNSRASQLITAAEVVENVYNCKQNGGNQNGQPLPANEAQARELAKLEPKQQLTVWEKTVKMAKDGPVTAKLVQKEVEAVVAPKKSDAKFNPTNENIDWAKWSWNPMTGCTHNCPYCYARPMSKRFPDRFPRGFKPHFRPERLKAPQNTTIPKSRENEPGIHNVFVCSMGDLFCEDAEQKWISDVLAEVRAAPQWNFIFLTKNPKRLVDIEWPDNAWVGTTVDRQKRVSAAVAAFKKIKAKVKFLSCEPFLTELKFPTLECFNWVIIGAQSSHGDCQEVQPKPEWVQSLMNQAWDAGKKVYLKPNLRAAVKDYPTG